jgi:1,4-dihydroxy-2-naphthoate octaprenyltransferase
MNFVVKNVITLFFATRPAFLTASAMPVIVGTAAGFAQSRQFDSVLFFLALFSTMLLHSGANVANDYFDHISRNDWLNKNPTPFSGGSRFIQKGFLSPRVTLTLALCCFAAGAVLGLAILLITKSVFILWLGLVGILGGFFYTAPPLKLGYRSLGEIAIAFLFGILPVSGAYYLQTGQFDSVILLPAAIVAILIFLIIFINEFPDKDADATAHKRTLVVIFGVSKAIWIYRIVLVSSYVVAIVLLFSKTTLFAGLFYLLTVPLAILAIKVSTIINLSLPQQTLPNKITIILHSLGCLALAAGFIFNIIK